ncbi:MAG: family N-acetyltransferase [Paenibacillus sp.]|nr:family N-acetyltransferase [Paenibacillus sp.]
MPFSICPFYYGGCQMQARILKGRDEFEEAAKLANTVFQREGRSPMEAAFPHIYSEVTSHSYGMFADNRLVSFIGFVLSVVAVGEARLGDYSIGSVCTHPDYAGKGCASELLRRVMRHADGAGASLILVSGNRPLYTRFGCYPFGAFARYRIDQEAAQSIAAERFDDTCIRLMEDTDLFALHRLHAIRSVRYDRSIWRSYSPTYSGTICIVNPARLLEQAEPYLRGKDESAFSRLSIERGGEPGHVIVACEGVQATFTDSELVSLLFDASPKLPDMDQAGAKSLQRLFPLPFPYVAGLNYI